MRLTICKFSVIINKTVQFDHLSHFLYVDVNIQKYVFEIIGYKTDQLPF